MGLDLFKLEKVKRQGARAIARCPACAEAGGDSKGEHLFINDRGQFGCVLYPGVNGRTHRQRIFELVGVRDIPAKHFEVKKPSCTLVIGHKVVQKDILGHLGRLF